MRVGFTRATTRPRSGVTSGWRSFVPSATLPAFAAQGRVHPDPAEALVASCAPRGQAIGLARRGMTPPRSRGSEPTRTIQIP